ncbi:MAG: hypothetical protein N2692_02885 [Patescibacteria group bacterium]|jgi:hypothetical protein|nr:hypothetical protein [Patescibacteria group bacterium]
MSDFQIEKQNFNIEQIEKLSKQIEEKTRENLDLSQKKDVLREVVGETIQQSTIVATPQKQQEESTELKLAEIKNLPEAEKIEGLVRIALRDSIADAVKVAQKLGPYYIDALHDALVDEFLNILIQQKKV